MFLVTISPFILALIATMYVFASKNEKLEDIEQKPEARTEKIWLDKP